MKRQGLFGAKEELTFILERKDLSRSLRAAPARLYGHPSAPETQSSVT